MLDVKKVVFCVILFVVAATCQDCKTPGQYCLTTENCCGGCCRDNVCISTTDACNNYEDPCLEHICPPGLSCYLYTPDCQGCETSPECG